MAYPGNVIENPRTGELVIFRTVSAETGGAFVVFDQILLRRGAGSARSHIHLTAVERYEILAGTASYTINHAEHTATVGDVVEIQPGTLHVNPWNNSDEELHLRRTVTPPIGAEVFYETLYGLARDGSDMNALQAIATGSYIQSETYFFPPNIPIFIQRNAQPILAFLVRLLGYKPYYPQYSDVQS